MQSPSIGEYASWVLFTYRLVDPNFSFEGKYEEEIPSLFRTLRYPFPLSKVRISSFISNSLAHKVLQSSIQSIGAPHAVPTFIAALEWLCDSVLFIQLQTSKDINSDSLGEASEEDVIFPVRNTT